MGEDEGNHPSGAKAPLILLDLAARLKSCPFKTAAQFEFFCSLRSPYPRMLAGAVQLAGRRWAIQLRIPNPRHDPVAIAAARLSDGSNCAVRAK